VYRTEKQLIKEGKDKKGAVTEKSEGYANSFRKGSDELVCSLRKG
jgi:hypothetical protein